MQDVKLPVMVVSYWNSTSNHNFLNIHEALLTVVSYWNSTSNHNPVYGRSQYCWLYLIEILHQTTTFGDALKSVGSCILLKFYIKPQLFARWFLCHSCCILLKFYIKPQRLTQHMRVQTGCILLKFYIKPQQRVRHTLGHSCCILLKFYIKPQRKNCKSMHVIVVSYWNSTSNHNYGIAGKCAVFVVSYWNSTSNHN